MEAVDAVDSVIVEQGVAGLAATACVRVHDSAGEVVGSAFAVGPDLVATCAHVVAAATGSDPYAPAAPAGTLAVDFPMLPGAPQRRSARVQRWVPIAEDGTGDVALLRLDAPAPVGTVMPPVRRVDGLWDHRFRVFGFPEGRTDGVWSTGRIRGRQATAWFQLQGNPGDQPIAGGFSGAPVWDDESGAVVGMTVAADRDPDVTTAYLIPVDQVLGLDPELLPNPYRGLEPFEEEHAEYFHGRDGELARLRAAVSRCALVAVAGPSGAGKSSLVHAGLVPVLRAEGARVGRVRAGASATVFAELAAAVLELVDPNSSPVRRARDTARIAGSLADPAAREAAVAELTAALSGPAGERLVLVLDQFEELAETEPGPARELLGVVTALVAADADVRVVLTVRGGGLDEVLTPDIAEALGSGTVLVGPMDRAALREAIVRPAERAPGLAFEDGLVERILDDAGAEPGQLPLVESLLARLWARREGGRLTLSGYEAAGGVAGALAAHADDVVGRLPEEDRARLGALLTRLVAPGRDGRFVRRSVPYAELPAQLRVLVPPLVAGRLLVVAGGERTGGTVDLAHQALIEHWPTLRDRCAEDRDFLVWRAELDAAHQRWQATDRHPSALLRGPALGAADAWSDRGDELGAHELDFLRSSRSRHRFETRRRRTVVAAVAALALVAGTLTVVAVQRGTRITAQQATAHAEALAAAATAHAERQPVLAAELALAAWRSDPTNAAAGTALGGQYLAFADTEKIISSQAGPIGISGGGDVVTAAVEKGVAVAFTGVLGDDPQRHDLPRGTAGIWPSEDGRYILVATQDNSVQLVDVAAGFTTEQLAAPGTTERRLAGMDPAASRAGWIEKASDGRVVLSVRDVAGGDTRTTVIDQPDAAAVQITADPDVVLVRGGTEEEPVLTVRSLSSGAVLRDVTQTWVVNSSNLVQCLPGDGTPGSVSSVVAYDLLSGAELRRVRLWAGCSTFWLSADGRFVIERVHMPAQQEVLRATSIETGQSLQLATPRQPQSTVWRSGERVPKVVMLPAPDGRVVGMVAVGGTLLRIRATSEPVGGFDAARTSIEMAGDTHVAITPETLATYERGSGQLIASRPRPPGTRYTVVDGLWLREQNGDRWAVRRYDLPTLHPGLRIDLPPDHDPDVFVRESADGSEQVVLALTDGSLRAWDGRTGAPLGAPVELARTPEERAWYRERDRIAMWRDDDPRQVIVPTPNGRLQIWDVPAGRLRHDLPIADRPAGTVVAAGDRLAAITATDTIEIWDLTSGRRIGDPMSAPGVGLLLGFDAEGRLASTHGLDGERLVLYDTERRAEIASLTPAGYSQTRIADDRTGYIVRGAEGMLPARIEGSAERWREHLCRLLPAEPSQAARELLPPGVDPSSPCG